MKCITSLKRAATEFNLNYENAKKKIFIMPSKIESVDTNLA